MRDQNASEALTPLFVHTAVHFARFPAKLTESSLLSVTPSQSARIPTLTREWSLRDRVIEDSQIELNVLEDCHRAQKEDALAEKNEQRRRSFMESESYALHRMMGITPDTPSSGSPLDSLAWMERFKEQKSTALLRSSKALSPEEKRRLLVVNREAMQAHFTKAMQAGMPKVATISLQDLGDPEELRAMLPLERLPEELIDCIRAIEDGGEGGVVTEVRLVTYPVHERPQIISAVSLPRAAP